MRFILLMEFVGVNGMSWVINEEFSWWVRKDTEDPGVAIRLEFNKRQNEFIVHQCSNIYMDNCFFGVGDDGCSGWATTCWTTVEREHSSDDDEDENFVSDRSCFGMLDSSAYFISWKTLNELGSFLPMEERLGRTSLRRLVFCFLDTNDGKRISIGLT